MNIKDLEVIFPNVILISVLLFGIWMTISLATDFLDERKVISECTKLGGPDAICYDSYNRGDFIEEYYKAKHNSEK